MTKPQNKKSDHIKNILHGFFLTIGTTIAEPHTILPLIVSHFGGGSIVIGFFSSLLRGGAILVQLYAAFHAQSYPRMLPYFRKVLITRFFAWLFIGICILFLKDDYPTITLWCIAIGLFIFSFSAGFGAIYFKEIVAKIFTHKFRGKTMSVRQFFSGAGAILSGAVTGYILQTYDARFSFGVLFVASSFIMGLGYLSIGTVAEPIKTKIKQKEKSFKEFLSNAFAILKSDRQLQVQIFTFLLAYSYLFALPFVIVEAKQKISLNGVAIGWLITSQMVGAMLSNIVWGKLSSYGKNKLIAQITIFTTIVALSMLFFIDSLYGYLVLFFLVGSAVDGNRIASSNLLLIIAPEDKRPIYSALQVNIVSFGMFFSILGGIILTFTSYMALYCFAILLLCVAFWSSFKLID
jgi:MFS family permease